MAAAVPTRPRRQTDDDENHGSLSAGAFSVLALCSCLAASAEPELRAIPYDRLSKELRMSAVR